MHRLLLLAALMASVASGQTDLHVTASQLSAATTKAMFGPLGKQYGAASVVVCNSGTASVSIPLAAIMQQPGAIPAGVTVLPPVAALAVISSAQNSTKKAKAFRIGIAAVESAAVAAQLSGLGATVKTVLTDTALLGGQLLPIFQQATTSQSLVNYAQATLPDPLQIVAGGCSPLAVVLIELDPKAQRADFRVQR